MSKRRRKAGAEIIIPTCYWWRDAEADEWIIIPGCVARANDPNACACNIPARALLLATLRAYRSTREGG